MEFVDKADRQQLKACTKIEASGVSQHLLDVGLLQRDFTAAAVAAISYPVLELNLRVQPRPRAETMPNKQNDPLHIELIGTRVILVVVVVDLAVTADGSTAFLWIPGLTIRD